jgi:hypothetical protein
MESPVIWDITPYSPVRPNRHFGGICRRLQGQGISQARNQLEAGSNATYSSGKSVAFQRTTLLYISEGGTLLCSVSDWPIVNNEQERMLKEAVVA